MSFFSKSLYRDVARNWRGLCFTYLVSLLALCSIPVVMKVQKEFSDFLNREAPQYIKQIPTITISKGKVSIDKPEPFFIRDEKTGAVWAIIDTTGSINSLSDPKTLLLLTRTALIVRKNDKETRTFDLSGFDNLLMDKSAIYGFLDTLDDWIAVLIYPFVVIFSFFYHAVEALIFALIGSLFARTLRASLDYRTLVRLANVAITPAIIGEGIFALLNVWVAYWTLLSLFISLGYIFYAVKANADSTG